MASPPTRESIDDWEHFQLYKSIREAIASLPLVFSHGNEHLRNHGDRSSHVEHRFGGND